MNGQDNKENTNTVPNQSQNVAPNNTVPQGQLTPQNNPIGPTVNTNVSTPQQEKKQNTNVNPTSQVNKEGLNTEVLQAPKEEAVKQTSQEVTDNFIKAHEAMNNKTTTTNVEKTTGVEITKEKLPFKKKVQFFFVGLFFILVAVFIYFLPEITEYLNAEKEKQEEVTTGVLDCKIERTSNGGLNTKISDQFTFKDKKLKKYKRTHTTKANSNDNQDLQNADTECNVLYEESKALKGIDISCGLKNKTQTLVEIIDYEKINIRKVSAAFTEAGATYPDYKLNENIDKIESTMKRSGFKCERIKRN